MIEWSWNKANFLISIHAVHVVLAHDLKGLTLFHVIILWQILNANVKLAFAKSIS
jgi:hypothetical protein